MSRTGSDEGGVALLFALLVVVLLEGLAALTLAATLSRSRLVAANRTAVEGRAVATDALATARVGWADTLALLMEGDTLRGSALGPVLGWRTRVEAVRIADLVILRVVAEFPAGDGTLTGGQTATLLLRHKSADTLLAIEQFPRW